MLIASYFNLKRKRPESRWTGLLKNISRNVVDISLYMSNF